MNEKRNWKQEIKEWWQENKKVIKVGVTCGLAGLAYGFIKGTLTVSNMLLKGDITCVRYEKPDYDSDELTEENCDDPDFAELVRFENENS